MSPCEIFSRRSRRGAPREPRPVARSWCARSDRRHDRKARSCSSRTTAASCGSVSGGCVEGAAAEEVARARRVGHDARHPLRDLGRSRLGRGACLRRHDRHHGPARGPCCLSSRPPRARRVLPDTAVRSSRHFPSTRPRRPSGPMSRARAPCQPSRSSSTPRARSSREPAAFRRPTPPLQRRPSRSSRTDVRRLSRSMAGPSSSRPFPVRPRLVIVGAVEVAQSLVRYAGELGYETVVVDGRASFATPERFPDVDSLVVAWPDEAFEELGVGPNDAVAILSHDPKFDEPAIVEATRRGARYVGAVGSRKTQADRRERLSAAGLSQRRNRPAARSDRPRSRRPRTRRNGARHHVRDRRRPTRRLRRPDAGARRLAHHDRSWWTPAARLERAVLVQRRSSWPPARAVASVGRN